LSPQSLVGIVLLSAILFQVGMFASYVEAKETPDFGLQRNREVHESQQGRILDDRTKLTITTKNGFNSIIDFVVTVDPKDSGVSATINGKTSLKIDPKKDNVGLSVSVSSEAPEGDYRVTITGTSSVDGQKITRTTFFIVKVKPPSEFYIEANPASITVAQGGTGSTMVKTTATKSFQNPINLLVWFKSSGFSSKFSGDGRSTMELMTQSFTNWFVEPKQNKPTNTKLEIKVDPQVPPGTYQATIEGTMKNVEFGAPKHTIPLTIHVTSNPEFTQLQDPTSFDMEFEHRQVTVEKGATFLNDIKTWSDRPDETITFTVSVSPANKGVSASVNEKRVTPNSLPVTGVFVIAAVSDSAKPGTYTVTLTGKTSTLYGKKLTQTTSFEIIVPQKYEKPISDPSEFQQLYKISTQVEKITTILTQANDAESKTLKGFLGESKGIYTKTKNLESQKLTKQIEKQIKDSGSDKKQISKIGSEVKKITKQVVNIAKENGIKKTELDKKLKDVKPKDTPKSPKSKEVLNHDQLGPGIFLPSSELDELGKILFGSQTEREKWDVENSKRLYERMAKELEAKSQNEKDSDAPPESVLDDVDTEIRGPDTNELKPNKEQKPDPKNTKPENPEAPPESILDDVDISGPDARAPKEKPSQSLKHGEYVPGMGRYGIDWGDTYEDMMEIMRLQGEEMQKQIDDQKILIDIQSQLNNLKQKIVIEKPKTEPVIQKDPIKLPETKPTETKPTEPKPSNTKPTMTIPKQVTQEATGPSGAPVNYNVSGQDKEDGAITPSCSYPSGYTFPIGTTTVSCTVDDSDDNSVSGTFTVTVRDTTPPNIPAFQPTEGVRDETGVQVFFEVTAYDLVDGNVPASCNYPSGYKFPIGTTVLTCTADDSRKNHASRSLQITVTIKESGQ